MTNILGPMERRAMCTTESFGIDAERTEIKIRTMSEKSQPLPTPCDYIFFILYLINLIYITWVCVPFEVYLWNNNSDEYIGIYLCCDSDTNPKKNINIVCHEGGHNKEKIVENAWDYDTEVTLFIRSLKGKAEVQINGSRRKTFHVPVPLERLAPYHIVIGQVYIYFIIENMGY